MNSREIDAKVAECLGWQWSEKRQFWRSTDGKRYNKHHEPLLPFFSTTGDGMLLLIEEARKQGIYLEFIHLVEGFRGEVRIKTDNGQKLIACMDESVDSAPLAVSLAFLKAKGVDVTSYAKGA
jgi:hypothetical protein